MRLITVREEYVPGQVFRLIPLGDIHLGSANCDTGALAEAVQDIKGDPLTRWIGMGDYIEAITTKDKRFSSGGLDPNIVTLANIDRICDVQVEKVSDILRPIADKCWSFGMGNHEATSNAAYGTDLCVRILERIGRPECYAGWSAIVRVVFENSTFRTALKVYSSHGWQAGRMDGAKMNQLDYLMGYVSGCQIYLQGHSHSRLVKTKTKLGTNPSFTKEQAKNCYGAHTGSFLRTYARGTAAYGERAGYPPVPIGPLEFYLAPSREGIDIKAVQ